MSPETAVDFLVKRDDLQTCRVDPAPDLPDPLPAGTAVLDVEAFSFTANNVTYGVMGDLMGYWRFFPAPGGWGRIPVWGFATVSASTHPDLPAGERVYGYFPMSTRLVVQPDEVGPGGFVDATEHRRELPGVYNRYLRNAGDPGYDAAREDEQMLLRPLFSTSFFIDDFLADNDFFGAGRVVVSSASSKTAYGAALLMSRREGLQVIGLTSPGNVDFVQRLGCYDEVVVYDDAGTIAADEPTAYVDVSGIAAVRSALHHGLGDALVYDCVVGASHYDELGGDPDLPGPAPALFFAPAQVAKRMQDWGSEGFERRLGEAWQGVLAFLDAADPPLLNVQHGAGPQDVERVYRAMLNGECSPDEGHILSLA